MASETSSNLKRPSWIDSFNDWVEHLQVPPWAIYVLMGLALIAVQVLFLWLENGIASSELLPVIIFNSLAVPYLLALIRLLDNLSVRALDSMRPILTISEAELADYRSKFASMPFLPPLVAGLAMTAFAILLPLVASEPDSYAALDQLSAFTVVFQIVDKASAFLFGVLIYHTIRQLRLIHEVNSGHVRLNIYQLRPIQSFSTVTAATAIGLVIFYYGWMLLNPELLLDPAILGVSLVFTALVIFVFVWPLRGMHTALSREKQKAHQEIERRFEAVFAQFNQYLAAGDFAATNELNGAIASLGTQQARVDAVPTWPWRAGAARAVATAVVLPILPRIIKYVAQLVFGA